MTEPTTVKAAGMVSGVAATAPALILGIDPATLSAAVVGALLSLAYSRPETWGSTLQVPDGPPAKRYAVIAMKASSLGLSMAASAIVGAWLAQALPHFALTAATAAVPQPPFAGLLAFAGQHVIPRALNWASRFVDTKGAK